MPKKISYIILYLFFIFDSFFSYYAITQLGGREANLVIAPYVEKYPLLYFLCIPALIGGLYLAMLLIKKYLLKIIEVYFENEIIAEKVILTSLVIYWGIGNSSLNFFYLLGFRHTVFNNWTTMTFTGICVTAIYLICRSYKLQKH